MTGPMLVLTAEAMTVERRRDVAAHVRQRRLVESARRGGRTTLRRTRHLAPAAGRA